jgi:hypothetical protein
VGKTEKGRGCTLGGGDAIGEKAVLGKKIDLEI